MVLRALCLISLLLSLSVFAAETKDLPLPIQALEKQGFTVKGQFTAEGVAGYALEYHGQGVAAFPSPDKKFIFLGNMIDSQGNDVSEPQLQKLVYDPMLQEMWQRLESSHWIAAGKGSRVIYAFFDPYCPYCSRFWEKARPWIDSDKVQLRVILVGILRKESLSRSAALMMAADPAKALAEYENSRWKTVPSTPGTIPDNIDQALKGNLELMQALHSNATPSIFYRDTQGQLQRYIGLPQDDATMETIMGSKP